MDNYLSFFVQYVLTVAHYPAAGFSFSVPIENCSLFHKYKTMWRKAGQSASLYVISQKTERFVYHKIGRSWIEGRYCFVKKFSTYRLSAVMAWPMRCNLMLPREFQLEIKHRLCCFVCLGRFSIANCKIKIPMSKFTWWSL